MNADELKTAVVTLVVSPLIFFALRKIKRFLQTHLGTALDAGLWLIGRVFKRSVARSVDFKRYCRIQLEKSSFRYLNVPGRSSVALETDSIFVPLTFETNTGESRSIDNLSQLGNRIRIVGDPGSGKTSLTKKMFRDSCRSGIRGFTTGVGSNRRKPRLPIAIELKTFIPPRNLSSESALAGWALAQLKAGVAAVQGFDMAELFDSYLSEYGLELFLDGLDEVSSDSYEPTSHAINALSSLLANRSPATSIYLTMRVQFHQQVHPDFDDNFPPVVQIKPFSPGDIYKFLTRWPFRDETGRNITRIYGELADRPTVREMCTNPLVLSMYVANDQDGETESKSPDTRTAFYSQVVEELLVARRSRQLGVTARSTLLEQRESILGRMAAENLIDPENAANLIAWNRAIDIIMEAYNTDREGAVTRLYELERDTGIISEERPGESLRFIHLTFCEYLAAKECAQGMKNGWSELISSHRRFSDSALPQIRTRLVEVIPFTVGLLTRSHRSDALGDVLTLNDRTILGRCLLETQLYESEAWQSYWKHESKYLIDIREDEPDQAATEWLNRLHLFNVVLSDETQWAAVYGRPTPLSLGDLFSKIVEADKERLTKVFSSYAARDPAASFRLAEATGVDLIVEQPRLVIDNLGNLPFLDIAVERARQSEEHITNWATAFAVGGIGNALVAAALNDVEPSPAMMRRIKEVDRKFKWYPFTLPYYRSPSGEMLPRLVAAGLTSTLSRDLSPSPSLFTASLTLAAAEGFMHDNDDKLTAALRKVKAPGRLVPAWVFRALSAIPVSYLVARLILTVISAQGKTVEKGGPWLGEVAGFLIFLAIIWLTTALYTYPAERLRAYWDLFDERDFALASFRKLTRLTGGVLVNVSLKRRISEVRVSANGIDRPN